MSHPPTPFSDDDSQLPKAAREEAPADEVGWSPYQEALPAEPVMTMAPAEGAGWEGRHTYPAFTDTEPRPIVEERLSAPLFKTESANVAAVRFPGRVLQPGKISSRPPPSRLPDYPPA